MNCTTPSLQRSSDLSPTSSVLHLSRRKDDKSLRALRRSANPPASQHHVRLIGRVQPDRLARWDPLLSPLESDFEGTGGARGGGGGGRGGFGCVVQYAELRRDRLGVVADLGEA